MPPTARTGTILFATALAVTLAASGHAQVYVPEPNDGPMTRIWLDSPRASPRAAETGTAWEGRDPTPPEEKVSSAPPRDPASFPEAAAGGSPVHSDSRVAQASHQPELDDAPVDSGTANGEPNLLRSADAIPLRRPDVQGDSKEEESDTSGSRGTSGGISGFGGWVTVGSSLAVVLGLFFVFAWFIRRTGGGGLSLLPKEAVEVFGRAPLAGNRHMQIVRFGNKVLLLAVSPEHVETLAEVTDPIEVDRLTGLCKRALPGSASLAFQKAFRDLERSSA